VDALAIAIGTSQLPSPAPGGPDVPEETSRRLQACGRLRYGKVGAGSEPFVFLERSLAGGVHEVDLRRGGLHRQLIEPIAVGDLRQGGGGL
jgi:hypothetical protein